MVWDLRHDYVGTEPFPAVEAVVHCAASLSTLDADTLTEANVGGTARVARAWPGVPIVFVSSSSVYPPSRVAFGGAPLREDHPLGEGLHDSYSRSKLEAERVLAGAVVGGVSAGASAGASEVQATPVATDSTGRSATILRASIIYGPGDRTILPRIRKLRAWGWVFLPGGKQRWSMTPIGLLCSTIRAAVEHPEPGVRVFNVAEDPPERVCDLFRRLLEEDAGRSLRVVPVPMWIVRAYAVAVETMWKLLRLTGEPTVTRSAVAYISEERILDLASLEHLLGRG
jgi:nucleoside-diphosphate-sugar epimerase